MITIVGGTYVERCIQPSWDHLFGSAGRAAAALSALTKVELVTWIDETHRRELTALTQSFDAQLRAEPEPRTLSFDYVHPLSVPVIQPPPGLLAKLEPLRVDAGLVLRFGMLQGDAIVRGGRVVYDPQSAYSPVLFGANGSTAGHLAIVANAYEVNQMTQNADVASAARDLLVTEKAEVVVVKQGSRGALVVSASATTTIPAYRTQAVFGIGSGDIFAAAFAFFWGEQEMDAAEAADLASRSAALYCESRSAPLQNAVTLKSLPLPPVKVKPGLVYLASPFFTLSQRWLVEEARSHLRSMSLEVFSPVHDVGFGSAETVAPADLAGLEKCDRVLALVDGADPGTLFEIGYARARGKSVIALAETLSAESLKMITGSGCVVTDDFATAIYLTAWAP